MVRTFIDFMSDFYMVPVIIVVGVFAGYFLAFGPHLILTGFAAAGVIFFGAGVVSDSDRRDFVGCFLYMCGILLFIASMWTLVLIVHVDWTSLGDGLLNDSIRDFLFR